MEVKDDRKSIITDVPSLVVMFKKKKKERKYSAVVQKVVLQSENMFSFGQHVLLWAGREEGTAPSAPLRTNLCKLLEINATKQP